MLQRAGVIKTAPGTEVAPVKVAEKTEKTEKVEKDEVRKKKH
jgi:hypothetical protein